jgi:hypothetical protein
MLDYDQKWSWLVGVSDFGLAWLFRQTTVRVWLALPLAAQTSKLMQCKTFCGGEQDLQWLKWKELSEIWISF